MKILITAATGYIGSYLLQYLSNKDGYQITAVDIRPPVAGLENLKNTNFLLGDCTRLEEKDLRGYDALIHLAAVSSHADANANPRRAIGLNVWGTANLAKAAKEAGVKRFIFPSTGAVYQKPLEKVEVSKETDEVQPVDIYVYTKLEAERRILPLSSDDFRVVVLRFGTVYGLSPRMRWDILVNIFTQHALLGDVITVYDGGKAWRSLVYIADVARCYEWALCTPSQGIFNIGEGDYTVMEVAEIFKREVVAKEISLKILPLKNPDEVLGYKVDTSKALIHGFRCQHILGEVLGEELRRFSERATLR